MSYSIRSLRRAQKALARRPKRDYERVRDAIRTLAENPRPSGAQAERSRVRFEFGGQATLLGEVLVAQAVTEGAQVGELEAVLLE